MSAADEREREEQALDALIVAAFRQEDCEGPDLSDVTMPEPTLSEEDRKAFDALGPNLVDRIIAGTWRTRSRQSRQERPATRRTASELAGAMHRSQDESDLTDQAKEEIERRIRELDEEGGQS